MRSLGGRGQQVLHLCPDFFHVVYQGRALGFVMTIFQKIAASSFAAVGATLRRRLLMLTIHEAVV